MTAARTSAAVEVQQLFDAKAATWPQKYAPDGPLAGRLASLLAAVHAHAPSGGRVLDLGCGTGELTRTLAKGGIQATGCDISPQMLRRAASEPDGCVGWVRLEPSWRTLPFASAAFDVVVAASVLEYVSEPAAVLAECARMVRPGGVVLYTVPDLRHPVRWAECFARTLAWAPTRSTRWNRYRVYLRASRQRHRVRWWLAASASAGLCPVPCPGSTGQPALRLLVFRRHEKGGQW